MRHRFVNHARNVWDRAVSLLPRIDQLWYKYIHMEEMLGNVAGARQVRACCFRVGGGGKSVHSQLNQDPPGGGWGGGWLTAFPSIGNQRHAGPRG